MFLNLWTDWCLNSNMVKCLSPMSFLSRYIVTACNPTVLKSDQIKKNSYHGTRKKIKIRLFVNYKKKNQLYFRQSKLWQRWFFRWSLHMFKREYNVLTLLDKRFTILTRLWQCRGSALLLWYEPRNECKVTRLCC